MMRSRARQAAGHRAGRLLSLSPRPTAYLVAGIALAYGVAAAIQRAWVCDDAFISFRCADHLVRGLGLVFNPGERVEGYTNFLWAVWVAAGMRWA